jgi:hypothetical protein
MQVVGVSCEVLFVLDNKLRGRGGGGGGGDAVHRAVPTRKSDMVLEDVAKAVFGNKLLDDMFVARKPLSLDELRTFVLEAVANPSLRMESGSAERIFWVACMAMKASLLRVESVRDVVSVVDDKLRLLQAMFTNPHMQDEIGRARSAMDVFYGSLSCGGLYRVRSSQINVLRGVSVPVATLINEGLQLETGHLIPRKSGPNSKRLGAMRRIDKDGSTHDHGRIPLADMDAVPHSAREAVGENLFESARERGMQAQVDRLGAARRQNGDDESAASERSAVDELGRADVDAGFTPPSPPSSVASGPDERNLQ